MNKRFAVAFTAAAVLAVPVVASAQHIVMMTMTPPANSATMMCRPVNKGEKPTAMMGSTALECKTMTAMMLNGKMKVPDTTKMAGAGSEKAWTQWLSSALVVPPGGTGGG